MADLNEEVHVKTRQSAMILPLSGTPGAPESGGGMKECSPTVPRGYLPAPSLVVDCWPPELQDNGFCLVNPVDFQNVL